ncbi:MAG TPA: PAS domain-containing protein, partial [Kofleriaceae bacterium]
MTLPGHLAPAFSFDSIALPAVLMELDGTIVAANAAAARIPGIPPEQLLGRTLRELAPDVASRWPQLLERARQHGEAIDETLFELPPNPPRCLQFMISIVQGPDREIVQGFAIDITAHKARVDAERSLAADQRLESLGLVAGGIAHDFNNLLVGVLGNAELALLVLTQGSEATS